MDRAWLDDSDLETPPLTRVTSASSGDGEFHRSQMELLVDDVAQINVSNNAKRRRERVDTSNQNHDLEQFETCTRSPVICTSSDEQMVSSPGKDPLPTFDDRIQNKEDDTTSQFLFGMASEGVVSSPISDFFSVRSDAFVKSPISNFFPSCSEAVIASPMSNTFPTLSEALVTSPVSNFFPPQDVPERADSPSQMEGQGREVRRKALMIGIKYYRNQRFKGMGLKGPHNDVREVQKLLRDVYGWSPDCFRVLKDDNSAARNQPTLANIKYEIKQLVADAQPGDHLFFYYSGHGGQIPDKDGDEEDGMDEFIYSCDGKQLVDDELHDILVKPIPKGCRLTALLDCCSSGTGLDLPYNATAEQPGPDTGARPVVRKHSDGDVLLLSACADAERAYEKEDSEDTNKRVRGMLTKAFIDSLKTRRKSTYDELLTSVRSQLERRKTMQSPQLSSSRKIDMNDYFDL